MKFKLIFILFNILVLASFFITLILPGFILNSPLFLIMGFQYWILVGLYILILAGGNLIYFYNREIFSLLEKKDFHSLKLKLRERIIERKAVNFLTLRIYLNILLAESDVAGLYELEAVVKLKKPGLYKRNILAFSIPHMAEKDYERKKDFLLEAITLAGKKDFPWMAVNLAITTISGEEPILAKDYIEQVLSSSSNPLVLVHCYYVYQIINRKDFPGSKDQLKDKWRKLQDEYNMAQLMDWLQKERQTNILLAFFKKLSDDVMLWYSKEQENQRRTD